MSKERGIVSEEMLFIPGERKGNLRVNSLRRPEVLTSAGVLALSQLACVAELNGNEKMEERLAGALSGFFGGATIYAAFSFFQKEVHGGNERNFASPSESRKGCLQIGFGLSPIIAGPIVGFLFPEVGYLCGGGAAVSAISFLLAKNRQRKER